MTTEQRKLLKMVFVTALQYHSLGFRDLSEKVLKGEKLKSIFGNAGDVFANCYTNILRLPPIKYFEIAKEFFEVTEKKDSVKIKEVQPGYIVRYGDVEFIKLKNGKVVNKETWAEELVLWEDTEVELLGKME